MLPKMAMIAVVTIVVIKANDGVTVSLLMFMIMV